MTSLPIPIQVIYVGLAAVVLSLIIATIQNKWSIRVFVILTLRLAIGWHFLFEGLHKIQSHSIGETETSRPFTSEPYFREAEGPLAPYMREQIGDPEVLLRQKVEPANVPERVARITDSNLRLAAARLEAEKRYTAKASSDKGVSDRAKADEKSDDEEFARCVPEAVRKDWDEFTGRFAEKYQLTDAEKSKLNGELTTAAMASYGRWVAGVEARDSKVKYVSGDTPLSAPQRLDYIRHRKADLDELHKRPQANLGNGYGYDMAKLKEMKGLVSAARIVLLADADALLAELKRDAFATVLNTRLERPSDDPAKSVVPPSKFADKDAARLAAFLKPESDKVAFESLPATLRDRWVNFHAAFKSAYPLTANAETAVDGSYALAKIRLASWYYDLDEFTGKDVKAGFGRFRKDLAAKEAAAAAMKKAADATDGFHKVFVSAASRKANDDLAASRTVLLGALDGKYADLRTYLTAAMPADTVKSALEAPDKKDSFVKTLDLRTRWLLFVVGACLLAGLFTRIACLAGGAFLVATYLTHPPFPWLPTPPGTEGNPIFVNKNVIEFLGLMVVLVHPTGRWMGIDSFIHRLLFRNAPNPA